MTKQRAELDDFEKEYWRASRKAAKDAEKALTEAQTAFTEAQIAFQGCAKMLQKKYGFSNETQIDENGEIIHPK